MNGPVRVRDATRDNLKQQMSGGGGVWCEGGRKEEVDPKLRKNE